MKLREIKASEITEAVARLCQQANFELGEDVLAALKKAQQSEVFPLGRDVLGQLIENAGIAARDLIGRHDLAFPFSESAVRTNEAMPLVSLDRLEGMLGGNLTGNPNF